MFCAASKRRLLDNDSQPRIATSSHGVLVAVPLLPFLAVDFPPRAGLSSLATLVWKRALYKGDTRTRTIDIYVDDVLSKTWTSSGTTSSFESVSINATGQKVELRGDLTNSEWLSISEVEIIVDDGADPAAVEAGTLGTVTTVAALYDPSGCDSSGCTASFTRDGDLAQTSRWSCAPKLGGTCTILYDLGAVRDLSELRVAMYKGTERTRTFEVYVDDVLDTTWTSSGTTSDFESIDLSGTSGQVIKLTGVLTNSQWLSIVETEIMVLSGGEAPTPTHPADLTTVGRLPLAGGSGSDLNHFYAKDGDFSTSWTCTSDPKDTDETYYGCSIYFGMFSSRHIKQVKIALPDGADREVDIRISFTKGDTVFEELFTSSGTTDGFETYDFDHFTRVVVISGVFTSSSNTISISEVEFLEEVQENEVYVTSFSTPYDNGDGRWNEATTEGFEWTSDSEEALDRTLSFVLSSFAMVTAIKIEFPLGDTYKFDLWMFNGIDREPFAAIESLESENKEGWQAFDLTGIDQYVALISIVIKGTGSGSPGFKMLNAKIIGNPIENPTGIFYVGSTYINGWGTNIYPEAVAEHAGDQKAIMSAICAVKKASFDGVDCVGEDPTATGTVNLPMGEYVVDGNIFMKSGVFLNGRFSIDDSPYITEILLEEGAAGKTAIDAIVVMDGISDAMIDDLWIRGLYNPGTSNDSPSVDGLGSTCLSVVNSQNITCSDTDVRYCDGDGVVMRDSNIVNLDAGGFADEYLPWTTGLSRGTGLVVDTCDSVWVRRHTIYENGVAGIHITNSNNFTFEATIGIDYGYTEGAGNVGSLDGQQPIEIIVESSSLVTFEDMKVTSANEPVMTISSDSSDVFFRNCGFSSVSSGVCVIQTEDPSVVEAEDDELTLVGDCFIKV